MNNPTTAPEGLSVLVLIREPERLAAALGEWLPELARLGRDYELLLLDGAAQPLTLPAEQTDNPRVRLVRPAPTASSPSPPADPPPTNDTTSPTTNTAPSANDTPPPTDTIPATPTPSESVDPQMPITLSAPAHPTDPLTPSEPTEPATPPELPGVGTLVAAAVRASRLPLVLIVGDDYPYAAADARRLLECLEKQHAGLDRPVDLVNGCRPGRLDARELAKRHAGWGWLLRVLLDYPTEPPKADLGKAAKRYARWAWLMFGVRVLDVQSGYKLVRRTMLERFPLQSRGEFVLTEILAKANFLVAQMDECLLSGPGGVVEINHAALAEDRQRLLNNPVFRHGLLSA